MFLTEEERKKIEQKIVELEHKSSGEIVVYCAKSSHSYTSAIFIAAFGGFFIMNLFGFYEYFITWGEINKNLILWLSVQNIIGAVIAGTLTYLIPKLKIMMVNNSKIEEMIFTKAKDVFLNMELFKTSDRTGILIYISLLEHKVIVLGDKGINAVIDPEEWDTMVNNVVKGIKEKNPFKGIMNAINDCERVLLKHGFVVKPNDINELPNHLIIEE